MPTGMGRGIRCLIVAAAVCMWAAPAGAQVLLRDDFDSPVLDSLKWSVPTGPGSFFGRTQIRPPSEALVIAGGVIQLQLDTYNPTAMIPGDSFWGSEIDTVATYALETGLSFEARVRLVPPIPGGLVGAVFSYVYHPAGGNRDEIDFEVLSNDVVTAQERVLTNVFDDDDFSKPGDKAFASIAGLDLTAFHTYQVRWLPGRVQWFVDGALVREESETVPDDPMSVRLNFWAPDASFQEAYDEALQPAATPGENQVYYYEVDYVEVRRLGGAVPALPLPGLAAAAAGLLLLGLWSLRRRGRSRERS